MRDINRIDPILLQLGEIWKQHPDLRLGQLIMNIDSEICLYYAEDKTLIKTLKTFYDKNDAF